MYVMTVSIATYIEFSGYTYIEPEAMNYILLNRNCEGRLIFTE